MREPFAEVVEDFAASLGASEYSLAGDSPFTLDLERSGRFCIESVGEDVLVYLVRDYEGSAAGLARTALLTCHPRHRHPWPVRAARVGEGRLLFAIRLPGTRAGVPELSESLQRLCELHDALEAGSGS